MAFMCIAVYNLESYEYINFNFILSTLMLYFLSMQFIVKVTVEPNFLKPIIQIPQFFKIFPWSLGFTLRKPYKLPQVFQTSIFQIPRFFEPCF